MSTLEQRLRSLGLSDPDELEKAMDDSAKYGLTPEAAVGNAKMWSANKPKPIVQAAASPAPAPAAPVAPKMAPSGATGGYTNPYSSAQIEPYRQVGNQMFPAVEVARMDPSHVQRQNDWERVYNLAVSKGMGYSQAAADLGIGGFVNPDLAPLTPAQRLSREQEQNTAMHVNREREIARREQEQMKLLGEQETKREGLARFQMGRAGTLYTGTEGGYRGEGLAPELSGPATRIRELRDEYDRAALQVERSRDEALTLAQEAWRDGKYEIAGRYYAEAKDAETRALAVRRQQVQDEFQAQQYFSEYRKGLKAEALETIQLAVQTGQFDLITPAYLEGVENALGAQRGFGGALVRLAVGERLRTEAAGEESARKAELESAKTLVEMLEKVPVGRSIVIDGVAYQGQKNGDFATGTETDGNGNVSFWSFDKTTGRVRTTNLGNIGRAEDGWETQFDDNGNAWRFNAKTGQMTPFYSSDALETWSEVFPDGTQSPLRISSDENQGQCGAFVNDLYGQRIIPNSYNGKLQACSQYAVPKEDVQVGDTFVMKAGTTGHIGIVNQVERAPNGKIVIRALESNMVPPGGRVISNNRTMTLDDPRLTMIARVPTPNLPQAGSDASDKLLLPTRPTFGAKEAAKDEMLKDRELTLEEAVKYEKPIGTRLSDIRGEVLAAPEEQISPEKKRELINTTRDQMALVDQILESPALGMVVGATKLERLHAPYWGAGERANFLGDVDRLISSATLNKLLELKKAGGTLGALSEGERLMLQASASPLGSRAIRKKNGLLVGFSMTEEKFKEEINRLRDFAVKTLAEAESTLQPNGDASSTLPPPGQPTQADIDYANSL